MYVSTGNTQCQLCLPGTSQQENGKTSCNMCEPGTYADNTGLKECIPCPYGLHSVEGSTSCPFCDEHFYLDDISVEKDKIFHNPLKYCLRCPQNAQCDANTEKQTIVLQPGFWRLSNQTSMMYSCAGVSVHCNSSREGFLGYCDDDRHTGPLCTVCVDSNDFFSHERKECLPCSLNALITRITILTIAAVTILLALYYYQRNKSSQLFMNLGLKEKAKILISFYQILATFGDIYGVRLSSSVTGWMSFLSLNLVEFLPLDCILKSTIQQLAFNSLWPYLLILTGALLKTGNEICKNRMTKHPEGESWVRVDWFNDVIQWSIVVVYFTLPTVTKGIFDAILCRAFQLNDDPPKSESYLVTDMSIQCDMSTTEYRNIFILFFAMFTVWIVITPMVIFLCLYRISNNIKSKRISPFANSLRFLWGDYTNTAWYWDIIDIYRKICLTGLIIFLDLFEGSNRVLRLLIAAVVSVLFLCVLLVLQPYQQRINNYYALVMNFTLVCCFVLGIILKLCEDEEIGSSNFEDNQSQSCSRFIGRGFNSSRASILVVTLAFGLLFLSMGMAVFLSYVSFTAPKVQVIATKKKPNLELPEYCTHHVFVSHTWKTGQAKTHAIVRKLQMIVPGLSVWLDVDELNDISKLEDCVEKSAVFILYYSKYYFESQNCRREVYAAMKFNKPMILIFEGGDTVIEEMISECTVHCESSDISKPSSESILKKLLGDEDENNENVLWINEGRFSAAAMNQLCYQILKHLPYYQKNKNVLREGIQVPGELGKVQLSSKIQILVYDNNEGCHDFANELKNTINLDQSQDLVDVQDAELYFGFKDTGGDEECHGFPLRSEKSLAKVDLGHGSSFFLLYLNEFTFRSDRIIQDSLISLVKACIEKDVKVILVNETDSSKGGCSFDKFLAIAPAELQRAPISLFNEISIPLFTKEEYRIVSIRQVLCKMGATESLHTRKGSIFERMVYCFFSHFKNK